MTLVINYKQLDIWKNTILFIKEYKILMDKIDHLQKMIYAFIKHIKQ